jgi:Cof subfamily protein (haloacid dehalogenase superfamily)
MYPKCLVSCEILDKWYTDRDDQPYTTETGRLFRPNLVAPLEQFCNQPITKLLLLGSKRWMDRLEPVLRAENPAVAVIRSDPELIQVMDRSCSKGDALKRVAAHYHIPMHSVMAIGDAANDVCMLQAAGVGVAMDNAHPAVKEVADWVAPSNNDHGVHAALVRYGLCG